MGRITFGSRKLIVAMNERDLQIAFIKYFNRFTFNSKNIYGKEYGLKITFKYLKHPSDMFDK